MKNKGQILYLYSSKGILCADIQRNNGKKYKLSNLVPIDCKHSSLSKLIGKKINITTYNQNFIS
jgi:hypothetical protein